MIDLKDHFAVIDLGTNTFHLLIVKKNAVFWEEVYRKRVFVNIAEEGISTIGQTSYARGIATITNFKKSLDAFPVQQVKAFGTAALRTASNGQAFQSEVKEKTGITIEIIDGHREAELIVKGTQAIVEMNDLNYLIMDIGGGSVEFILIQNGKEAYIESLPIGITSLYACMPHSEPITTNEIKKINDHLSKKLVNLKSKIFNLNIEGLIGASGSYEVLEKILSGKISKTDSTKFSVNAVIVQIDKIIKMNLDKRSRDPNIPLQRAKLIVVAFLLMKHVFNLSNFSSLIISPYALKEGALIEMMNLD